jgi:hypothetical protein
MRPSWGCQARSGLVRPRSWSRESMTGFQRLSQLRRGPVVKLSCRQTGPGGRIAALASWSRICSLNVVDWADLVVRTVYRQSEYRRTGMGIAGSIRTYDAGACCLVPPDADEQPCGGPAQTDRQREEVVIQVMLVKQPDSWRQTDIEPEGKRAGHPFPLLAEYTLSGGEECLQLDLVGVASGIPAGQPRRVTASCRAGPAGIANITGVSSSAAAPPADTSGGTAGDEIGTGSDAGLIGVPSPGGPTESAPLAVVLESAPMPIRTSDFRTGEPEELNAPCWGGTFAPLI